MAIHVKVRRPNGEIETVDVSKTWIGCIPPVAFAKMVEATRNAGRGELLSWEDVREKSTKTSEERAWGAVQKAFEKYHSWLDEGDNVKAIKAGENAEKMLADYRDNYPDAAAKRDAEETARKSEILNRPSTQAMLEGRD